MTLIFDIETDGLCCDLTRIHCIGIYDDESDKTMVFNDIGNAQPITKGVQLLEDADVIVGHNIIGFDIPAIKRVYPWFKPTGLVMDTLLLSRLYHTNLLEIDKARNWKQMPVQLYGRHSLESHGYRLGEYKGDFGKTADWSKWSQDMQDYMLQDVNVTRKLWLHFHKYLNG